MKDKENRIQTGLRMPEEMYDKIALKAMECGSSINSYMLVLVSLGMQVIDSGLKESRRSSSHNQKRNSLE